MRGSKIVQQVRGILALEGVEPVFASDESNCLMVPVPRGSAVVMIRFRPWGEDTVIVLSADLLDEIDFNVVGRHEILTSLNGLNARSHFGKFYLDEEKRRICLEYDLLGDHLQSEELMNALKVMGQLADDADDELQRRLGSGRRAMDVLAWLQEHLETA